MLKELLFHGQVGVKDENEKEYVAYLFEKIVFFTEIDDNKNLINRKKKSKFSTRKRSTSSNLSSSTTNLLESINNSRKDNTLPLELREEFIYRRFITFPLKHSWLNLIISWSGRKESGSFTLRYRSEEARNQWEKCLRDLKTNEMNKQIHKSYVIPTCHLILMTLPYMITRVLVRHQSINQLNNNTMIIGALTVPAITRRPL